MIRFSAILLILTGLPAAFGWGCEGHQAIGLIARDRLPLKTVQKIEALLKAHPGPAVEKYCGITGLPLMADLATWADDYRAVNPSSGNMHFIDIPISVRRVDDVMAYCPNGDCVVQAIRSNFEKLKTSADDEERAFALRYLLHFVGDVHQPLHVSTNNDKGGNCTAVSYFTLKSAYDPAHGNVFPNLHTIWDGYQIRTYMRENDLTVDSLARKLEQEFKDRYWEKDNEPAHWAVDSFSRSKQTVYGSLPVRLPAEQPVHVEQCTDDNGIGQRTFALGIQLDSQYLDSAIPLTSLQLMKAGVRLADLLEEAFR